ncbi:MAG: hypothetical protein KGN02_05050 [bacterium]|nr:hypothetical protein [bacterium]
MNIPARWLSLVCLVLTACSGALVPPTLAPPPLSSLQLNPSPLELTSDAPAAAITAQGDAAGVAYTPHADSSCASASGSISVAGDGVAQTDVAGAPLLFVAVATGTPPASCSITVSGSDGSTATIPVTYTAITPDTTAMNALKVRSAALTMGSVAPAAITIDSPTDVVKVTVSGFSGATSSKVSCNTSKGIGVSVFPASFTTTGSLTIAPYGQGALSGNCTVSLSDSTGTTTLSVTLSAPALNKLTVVPATVQFSCVGSAPQTCSTGSVAIAEQGAAKFRINDHPSLINSCANVFNGSLKMHDGNGTYASYVAGPQSNVSFYGLLLASSPNCTKIFIGDGGAQTVVVRVDPTVAIGGSPAQAASCTGPDPLVPVPNAPHGLYVWNPYHVQGNYESMIENYVLGHGAKPIDPNICGVSLVIRWSDVEPQKGKFQWDIITSEATPYVNAGLRVNLLFADASEVESAGSVTDAATPQWVFNDGVGVISCPGQVQYPNWLDPTFEADYEAFIKAAVAEFKTGSGFQYASNIGYIRFGIGAGVESYPGHIEGPNTMPQPCLKAWKQANPAFSYDAWLNHSLNIVRFIAQQQTDKQLMISLNYVSTYDSSNPNDAYTYANAVAAVAAPNGIAMGTQNLGISAGGTPVAGANAVPTSCDPTKQYVNIYWCQAYRRHLGVVPFEFQPIVSPLAPGSYDVTIAHLFEYGLDNNAQIFEIYPQDWVYNDDPAAFPGFTGATQAQYNAAFSAASLVLGRNH